MICKGRNRLLEFCGVAQLATMLAAISSYFVLFPTEKRLFARVQRVITDEIQSSSVGFDDHTVDYHPIIRKQALGQAEQPLRYRPSVAEAFLQFLQQFPEQARK